MARPSVHARPILELSSEESDDSSESNPTEESSEGPLEEEDDSLESDASESDYEQPKSKKKSKQKNRPIEYDTFKETQSLRNEGNQVTIDLTEGSHPNDKAKQRNGATTTPATIDLSKDVIEAAQSPSAAASTASDAPRVERGITRKGFNQGGFQSEIGRRDPADLGRQPLGVVDTPSSAFDPLQEAQHRHERAQGVDPEIGSTHYDQL
ncbi:unnamed protein product [Aphanomyces euteiches]